MTRHEQRPGSFRSGIVVVWLAACAIVMPAAFPARAQSPFAQPGEPLDYTLLNHKVSINLLRAGAHAPSGTNEYFFQGKMIAMLNTAEERNLALEKRKKLELDLGKFGDTNLEALAIWKPDEKAKDVKELTIEGPNIRELIAKTMQELAAGEPDICVLIEVALFEKRRKWLVLTEEQQLASASYYPVPPTIFDNSFRTNTVLNIKDAKGLEVKLQVQYESPANKGKTQAPKPSATSTSQSADPKAISERPESQGADKKN